MTKKLIRDKLLGKEDDQPGIEQLRDAAIKAIKGILAIIKKHYEIEMNITCIIAGVGTVSLSSFSRAKLKQK